MLKIKNLTARIHNFVKVNKFFSLLVFIYVVFSILIHRNWLFSLSPIVSGDWQYFNKQLLMDWGTKPDIWISYDGLGRVFTQTNFTLSMWLYGLLAKLGFNFEFISRLVFFYPIFILAPIGSFRLGYKLSGHNKYAGFLACILYTLNSYFVVIKGGHMHLSMVYSLAPFIVLNLIHPIRHATYKNSLLFFVCMAYDVRTSLLLFALALAYTFFSDNGVIKHKIYSTLKLGIFVFLLNLYWIIPQLLIPKTATNSINPDEFEPLNWANLGDSIALHNPFWNSNSGVQDFTFNKVTWFYFVPLFTVMILAIYAAFKRKQRLRNIRNTLLISTLALLSAVLFTKQLNEPFSGVYTIAMDYVPMLNIFRDGTKFMIITACMYSVMIGLIYKNHRGINQNVSKFATLIVLLSSIFIVKPLITEPSQKTYKSTQFTPKVSEITDIVNRFQPENTRSLWVSRKDKFTPSSISKPALDALLIGEGFGRKIDNNDRFGYLKIDNSKFILNTLSINALVIPDSAISDSYVHYQQRDAEYYQAIIGRIKGLKIEYDQSDYHIYSNDEAKEMIYLADRVISTDNSITTTDPKADSKTTAYLFDNTTKKEYVTDYQTQPLLPRYFVYKDGEVSNNYPIKTAATENIGYTIHKFDKDVPRVGDCNNADKSSLSENQISMNKKSEGGVVYANVTAAKHIACASFKINNFERDSDYILGIRYRNNTGSKLQYSLYPYENEETRRRNVNLEYNSEWTNYQRYIPSSDFGDQMNIVLFLPATRKNLSSADIEYIYIVKIPKASIQADIETVKQLPETQIKSKFISQSKLIVETPRLDQPRVLVFNQTYHSGWKLYKKEQNSNKKITAEHIVINGFANGWILPANTDKAEYVILFDNNRILYYSYIISAVTALGLTGLYLLSRRVEYINNNF